MYIAGIVDQIPTGKSFSPSEGRTQCFEINVSVVNDVVESQRSVEVLLLSTDRGVILSPLNSTTIVIEDDDSEFR